MIQSMLIFCLFIGICFGGFTHIEKNDLYTDSFNTCKKMSENTDIEKIFLVAKNKEVIKKEHFEKVPNLKSIHLKDAANGIERDAFEGLNIKNFECNGCDFSEITENFINAPTLKNFHFAYCKIKNIKPKSFKNLKVVEQAWINGNSIKTVYKGVFSGLPFYMVNLENNQIEHIEDGAFVDMKNLGYLDLTNNLLTHFDGSKIIGPSHTIDVLQLSQNRIQEVKKEDFSTLFALEFLNLTRNSLTKLKCCSFLENKNLSSLDLSHNKIKYIKPDLFCEDNNVKHLFLHDNYISFLDSEVINKIPKLSKITTAGNLWYCSCKDNFKQIFEEEKIIDVCEGLDVNAKCIKDKKCEFGHEEGAYDMVKTKGEKCYSLLWRKVIYRWRN